MNIHNTKKSRNKNPRSDKSATPNPDARTPDSNVGPGELCLVPSFPESSRLDTGEPCDDGRGAGQR